MIVALRTVLICDLNNFALYPTIPVGYLASILRGSGFHVRVFSPLADGVGGITREAEVPAWGLMRDRLLFWSALTPSRAVRRGRRFLAAKFAGSEISRREEIVLSGFEKQFEHQIDAVLISTYLMYFPLVRRMCAFCAERGIPVLVGGPYFADAEVRQEWLAIPGLTGLAAGEIELEVPSILQSMLSGSALSEHPGVATPYTPDVASVAPLRELDRVPFPDYSDFPWNRYPRRIIPLVTGRGCGWGVCRFCSDITSTAGRSYRSRSVENVLGEIEYQTSRFRTSRLAFTDLKLNSNLVMWRTLLEELPRRVSSPEWIASLHVDGTGDHGLSTEELRKASAAGMVRMTTGLESGSQRVLDLMHKGTNIEETTRVLRDAARFGISVRVTMVVGYPGEEADDVNASADFLERHDADIERVSLSRFTWMTGTAIDSLIRRHPERFPAFALLESNHREALVEHHNRTTEARPYRRALSRLLAAVHRINRKPLSPSARAFEGVM